MDRPGAEDYVAINRGVWTKSNARYTDARASASWQQPDITWGIWKVPEALVRALPPSVALMRSARYYWYVDALLADGRALSTGVHEFMTGP